MKRLWLGLLCGCFSLTANADMTVENVGFATPESVEYSVKTDRYYVANINGSPFGKDNNGFISLLNPQGEVEQLKWVEGGKHGVVLNAPKGMVAIGNRLYVADIDRVRIFSLPEGKPLLEIPVPDASFLNGVTPASQGGVWVTDSGVKEGFKPNGKDAIYHISPQGELTTLVKDMDLGRPNGILEKNDELLMVTIGSGEVHHFDLKGKLLRSEKMPFNRLDGLIEDVTGKVIFSSWTAKAVLQWQDGEAPKALFENMQSPADLGLDSQRNRVLIPSFMENKVWIRDLQD
ncbi:SMP-30/gluconolactonase/LRE family protein [Thiomicrorhabdus xiamenensis]|uniref:SMP-30/gluconolactonase/LRE family protein n=1 Tax=Thiomicrorhabdus xiamenensis TaxID=2739063 RepID=A0A7D4NQ09_9GAMM|nr:SMP-30/gluconolactonase/LRE family protein [Thiomicrorhabdus xiamenensis]QKI90053.1 SMP-30/gluconolactonase/LRE family protein [Thiomicrorhabdus xiamenensis]